MSAAATTELTALGRSPSLPTLFDNLDSFAEGPEGVAKLRAFVLDLAVRGKLVEQDENDEPASELLERAKAEKALVGETMKYGKDRPFARIEADEIPFEVPNGWWLTRIGEFAVIKGGKRLPKGTGYSPSETPYIYIRVTDLKNGTINTDRLKYIDEEVHEQIKRYIIEKDDLYITIAGTVGDVGEVPQLFDRMNLTENAAKLVFRSLDKCFLAMCLRSRYVQDQLEKVNQMAQPKLALKRIASSAIAVPPLSEQRRIVSKVDGLMSLCDELESILERKRDVTTKLLSALIHQIENT